MTFLNIWDSAIYSFQLFIVLLLSHVGAKRSANISNRADEEEESGTCKFQIHPLPKRVDSRVEIRSLVRDPLHGSQCQAPLNVTECGLAYFVCMKQDSDPPTLGGCFRQCSCVCNIDGLFQVNNNKFITGLFFHNFHKEDCRKKFAFFTCGEADRSQNGKSCSCCCCWGLTTFELFPKL